jgi:sulfur transfer protein SufE
MPLIQDDYSSVDISLLQSARGWQDKFRILTIWGDLVKIKAELRVDNYRVTSCAIPTWLYIEENDIHFDSDSRIMNGLMALIIHSSINSPKKSVDDWSSIFLELGLEQYLTPSRTNGIKILIRRVWGEVA